MSLKQDQTFFTADRARHLQTPNIGLVYSAILSAVATTVLFSSKFFSLCVTTITHEPLHLGRWNFAQTCILTTVRNSENLNVTGRKSRSRDRIFEFFITARYGQNVCGYDNAWTAALSLVEICTNTYLRNLEPYWISTSKVNITWCFCALPHMYLDNLKNLIKLQDHTQRLRWHPFLCVICVAATRWCMHMQLDNL